jgi:hypothetical protein
LLGGVRPDELARYIAYEAVFVVGPGWLVLRAIAPGVRSRAWQLALGWPIGLTLEILAFSLTAAAGFRDLFFAYPVLVGVPAALALRRRMRTRGSAPEEPPSLFTPACRWALAGSCLLAFAYIGAAYFTITPLPGSVDGVVYPDDATFHLSVAASALHDWPPTNLGVAGEPFDYHYFSHLHTAAIAQVTGIDLPTIVFRLYPLPWTALLILGAALVGRLITGRPWGGVLTVGLVLLVHEIDLSVFETLPFGGWGAIHLWSSPSQLLGMAFLAPIVFALWLLLDPRLRDRGRPWFSLARGELLVVLALLLIGAAGAKSAILPVLLGGLLLYLLWTRLGAGRIDTAALAALGLCLLVFAASYLLLYSGGSGALGPLDPPGTIGRMQPLVRIHEAGPGGLVADAAFWAVAVPAGTVFYFGAPLLGLVLWLRRRPIASLDPGARISISLLLAGAVPFFLFTDDYGEQTYFTAFGLIAVLPFAASGLIEVLEPRLEARGALDRWRLASFAAAWIAATVLVALLADRLVGDRHYLQADLAVYLPVLVAIGAIALAAILSGGRQRAVLGSFAVVAALLTATLDTPLDLIPRTVRQLEADAPLYASSPAGLRPDEHEAMEWIRDNLPRETVLAVSNDRTPLTRHLGPSDSDYPAFTEHRTFREGWKYSRRANGIGQFDVQLGREDPLPERTRLESAVYTRGDLGALRTMVEQYGVTHIVVSRKDGAVSPRVYGLGRLVYSNGAVDVVELPD